MWPNDQDTALSLPPPPPPPPPRDGGTADAEIKALLLPPWWEPRADKGSLFLTILHCSQPRGGGTADAEIKALLPTPPPILVGAQG